jgi:hypothetical protein
MRKPKANRSYSLDLEVIMMLEKYAAASDTWGKRKSRSKIVNDAIRWYISGDTADLVDSQSAETNGKGARTSYTQKHYSG